MSVFFLTTVKRWAADAQNELKRIYKNCVDVYDLESMHLVITPAYRKQFQMRAYKKTSIYILGTIFNEKGFYEQLLDSYQDGESFLADLKNKKQLFLGHYLVIAISKQNQRIEIIPDRVGMINTYYSIGANGEVSMSNDLLLVSRLSGNSDLCRQAVYEFLLTESNVGNKTIFENIFRLKMGNQLLLTKGKLKEKGVYDYRIIHLNKEEYAERIKWYFQCLDNFHRKITVDVSAGYDTRLIISIAKKYIKNVEGINSFNKRDNGIDEEISRIIARKIDLKLHRLKLYEPFEKTENIDHVLHGTSVLRDADRSATWPDLFKEKYQVCDLSIGGYGGEVIRAKYNKYPDIQQYVKHFYKGNEAEIVCKFRDYQKNILEELEQYPIPFGMNQELLQNWYYAAAKMRIWGSGFIQMASLYGDVVHPFMDWYLLNPLFGFRLKELESAEMQDWLISLFAPELKGIPINKRIGKAKRTSVKDVLMKCVSSDLHFQNLSMLLYCLLRNVKEYETVKNFEDFRILEEQIETSRIFCKLGKRIRSRGKTVLLAYKYSIGKI